MQHGPAASSGSNPKAPGSAGGYLLIQTIPHRPLPAGEKEVVKRLSGDLPTPTSCKNQQTTARGNEARQAGTDDGAGDTEGERLGSDLPTGVNRSVNVKISLSVLNSRDRRRLSLLEPAL